MNAGQFNALLSRVKDLRRFEDARELDNAQLDEGRR
jgi:hypothetical protein